MRRKLKTTPAQEVAHLRRLDIINAPFPPIRPDPIPGKTWAGALITHDDDAMFLRGQRDWAQGHYDESEVFVYAN